MASEQSPARDTDLSTLVSSASLVLVGSLFGAASKLVEQFIIGNVLSTGAYGEVNTALSIMSLSTTIALVGLDEGVPRFISRFDDSRDRRGIWLVGLAVAGSIGIAIALGFILARDRLLAVLFEAGTPVLLPVLFALSIPFFTGLRVAVGTIRGHENTIYRTYAYDLLYNGLRLVALVVLLLAGLGVLAAGYAYLLATVVAFVVAHALLNRLLDFYGRYRTHTRALVRFSAPLVVASAVSTLFAQIDTLMLASFASSEAVGFYNYGYQLAAGLPVILSVFGFLYMPLASRLDADGNRREVDRVYTVTTKWIYIAAFPVLLAFVAFSGDVVSMFFSDADGRSAAVLAVLAVGFFMSAANGRCQDTLSAFGYTGYILVVNIFSAVVNVALNVALIPAFGVIGAAVASALSYFTLNATALLVLWRFTGITPFSKESLTTFVVLPLALFPPAVALSQAMKLSILTLPVFGIVAGLAAVVLVVATGCLQPEDEIPLNLIEERLGIRIPFIRHYIPSNERL